MTTAWRILHATSMRFYSAILLKSLLRLDETIGHIVRINTRRKQGFDWNRLEYLAVSSNVHAILLHRSTKALLKIRFGVLPRNLV